MEAEGLMPELDDIMAQLEAKYGRRLPHGYNPNLPFMSHLWEPLRHMYRCASRMIRLTTNQPRVQVQAAAVELTHMQALEVARHAHQVQGGEGGAAAGTSRQLVRPRETGADSATHAGDQIQACCCAPWLSIRQSTLFD
jgi:hypothetical protein